MEGPPWTNVQSSIRQAGPHLTLVKGVIGGFLSVFILVGLPLFSGAATGGQWTEIGSTQGTTHCGEAVVGASTGNSLPTTQANPLFTSRPPARGGAAQAFDAADGYVLMFGGMNNSTIFNDTWSFKNGTWTRLHPASSPTPRSWASMAYDPKDGVVLLFGGWSKFPSGTMRQSDTWTFSHGNWTNLSARNPSAVGPPEGLGGAMAYDGKDGYILYFGGNGNSLYFDTWKFSGGNWTLVSANSGPLGSYWAGMAYDAKDGYTVLFGGHGYSGTNATWKYIGGIWTQLHPSNSPTHQRNDPGLAYDRRTGYILMFGGTPGGCPYNQTWKFSGGNWTKLNPAPHPSGRWMESMVFDQNDHYMFVFGGETSCTGHPVQYTSDSWKWTGSWTRV